MKTKALLLVLALATLASAQTPLPNNFAAAGAGFQSTASPQVSGWATGCRRNPDLNVAGMTLPSYACFATDTDGVSASTRGDLMTVIFGNRWFAAGTKTGVGFAYASDANGGASLGKSYDLGGWATVKVKVVHLVISVTSLQQDIKAAIESSQGQAAPMLKEIARRTCFRFGVGKSW